MPLLPNLGGKGTMLFVLVGIVGVLAVLLSYKKVKKRIILKNRGIWNENKLKKVIAYVLSFMMLFTMSAMNIGSVSAASTGSIIMFILVNMM